jgi:2-polyprenyl-3-methyl-5-hydroxy-6-metoxy-1,4-benzoquinol methylase
MKKYAYTVDIAGNDAPAKILRAVGHGKRVLEVGCASGVQSKILSERQGCRVTGIEINPFAAEEARRYCESVIVADLESLSFDSALGGEEFDVIIIADVLEHLREPASVLGHLKNRLLPEGRILASIPNVVYAGLILQMVSGRFDYRPYGLLDDTHLRFFTLKSIYRLFESCALAITDLDRVLRPIEGSEFYQRPLTEGEAAILDFIKQQNREWETYQFIITAMSLNGAAGKDRYAEIAAEDRLNDLELEKQALINKVRMLEGQISWLESHPVYRVLRRIKAPFHTS